MKHIKSFETKVDFNTENITFKKGDYVKYRPGVRTHQLLDNDLYQVRHVDSLPLLRGDEITYNLPEGKNMQMGDIINLDTNKTSYIAFRWLLTATEIEINVHKYNL